MPTIVVSAVVFRDPRGRVLTVRKRGTDRFMLPGGKPEPGEDAAQAAAREVREELGLEIAPEELTLLGEWTTDAANEPGHLVRGTVFTHPATVQASANAEIEDVRWLAPEDAADREDLAPLLAQRVLPAL